MESDSSGNEVYDLADKYQTWFTGAVIRAHNLPPASLGVVYCEETEDAGGVRVYVQYTHPTDPYYNKMYAVRADVGDDRKSLLNFTVSEMG